MTVPMPPCSVRLPEKGNSAKLKHVIKNLISLLSIIILFVALLTLLVYIWLLNSSTIYERREPTPPPVVQPR